ncbi:HU family DNA-binding protein [Candidatus Latescibacterota bacterium]
MEITREILIKELKERIDSQSVSSEPIDSVVDALFGLVKSHLSKGDKVNIREFSVRSKGYWKKKNQHSHGRSHKDSKRTASKSSSNFILNELFLMLGDIRYLGRKILQFGKTVVLTVAFLMVFYILSVLMGC